MKKIVYLGGSEKAIEVFPSKTKQRIITALTALSAGIHLNPNECQYMSTVGMGVYEIRVKVDRQYRIFYVAKFEEAVYVLHAFVKKTQETPQKDIKLGSARYKALLNKRQEKSDEKAT